MNIRREILKVAEHCFAVEMPQSAVHGSFESQYMPFSVTAESNLLFTLKVVEPENFNFTVVKPLLEDIDMNDSRMVRINVYLTTEGYLYNIIMPGCNTISAKLHVNREAKEALVVLGETSNAFATQFINENAFNNAVILSYLSFAIEHSTLLLHSSTVVKEGKAYMFLGKSGTGKSTHSRMWLESFKDAYLLNDDHPIIRYWPNGEVVAYGSPWSGKTPCYKNLEAPVAAIVRIKRAPYNKLTKLSNIKAYASLISTISGVQWCSRMADYKSKALESVITSVSSFEIECLPENGAAVCCWEGIHGY